MNPSDNEISEEEPGTQLEYADTVIVPETNDIRLGHMYWTIDQARLVTHGFFSDYVASRPLGTEHQVIDFDPAPSASPTVLITDGSDELERRGPRTRRSRIVPRRDRTRILDPSGPAPPKPKLHISMPRSAKKEQSETLETLPTRSSLASSQTSFRPGGRGPADKHSGSLVSLLSRQNLLIIGIVLLSGTIGGAYLYNNLRSALLDFKFSHGSHHKIGSATKSLQKNLVADSTQGADSEALAEAERLEDAHQYEESYKQYDQVISKMAKPTARVFHGRGRVLRELKRYHLAREDFEKAAELAHEDQNILLDLAGVDFLLKDYTGAITIYDKLLEKDKRNVDALYGRGISNASLDNLNEAISDFQDVVSLDPKYAKAYEQLAMVYITMGLNERAEEVTTAGIKCNENDEDLLSARGWVRWNLGKKESAVKDYTEAIRLNPRRKDFYNDRGYVLMDLGRYKQASADFNRALQIDPSYEKALDNLETLKESMHSTH